MTVLRPSVFASFLITGVIGLGVVAGCQSGGGGIAPDVAQSADGGLIAIGDESDLPPLEPGDWSEFEGGVSPFDWNPDPENAEFRSVQDSRQGSALLRGELTEDPWLNPPYQVGLTGELGEVLLIKAKAEAFPSADNAPRLRFMGDETNYGYLQIPTNNTFVNLSILMEADENVTFSMFNAPTDWDPMYDEGVRWTYWFWAQDRNDAGEPNDDGDHETVTDRADGETVPLNRQVNRSMWSAKDGSGEDTEDWYTMDLNDGLTYRFIFGTTNAIWGRWSHTVNIYDAEGELVHSFQDFKGITAGFNVEILEEGIHHVQVLGSPRTGRGASVYYSQYALMGYKRYICERPTIDSATVVGDVARQEATFSFATEDPWNNVAWNFGGGALVESSTEESPTVNLTHTPGIYEGVVTVGDGPCQTDFRFNFEVKPRLIPLNIIVIKSLEGEFPTLWWELADWTLDAWKDWVDTHQNSIYLESGMQFDLDRLTLQVVEDRPEWFTIDSGDEYSALRSFVGGHDSEVVQLAIIENQTYSGWGGVMFDFSDDCNEDNLSRGCICISSSGHYAKEVFGHELGHVFNLPHVRTQSEPRTELNDNLMSYNRQQSVALSHLTDREAGNSCVTSGANPMDQYQTTYDWISEFTDWVVAE